MAGYTRNDTGNNIADGNIINASDLDGEFDAVEAAFNASTGHTHDGTSAEGAPIEKVGPAQDLVITATEVKPKTDNTLDLGTSLLEFKDLYLDGTANIDSLVADTADINAGSIDGATLGTNSAITEAQIDNININGNTISSTDTNGNITLAPNGTGVVALSSTDLTFGDNDKAIFGAGSDLQIYHTGSASIISDQGTGNLQVLAGSLEINNSANSENMITANENGAVSLFYDSNVKLATTNTGIDVTGTVTADDELRLDGGAPKVKFFESDTTDVNTSLSQGGGNLYFQTYTDADAFSANRLRIDNSTGDISFYEDTGTTPKLFWDASAESLGIGTTSPNTKIEALTDSSGAQGLLTLHQADNTGGNSWGIDFRRTANVGANQLRAKIYAVREGGDATALAFSYGDSSGTTEAVRINSSGNVGIGTASPTEELEVVNSTGTAAIKVVGTGGQAQLQLDGGSAGSPYYIYNPSAGGLIFQDNSTERMRIDSSGNVGIGTSSPTVACEISNSSLGNQLRVHRDFATDNATSGVIFLSGDDDAGNVTDYAELKAISNDVSNGSEDGSLVFSTMSGGSLTEHMRIDSSGNLLVGKTEADSTDEGVFIGTAGAGSNFVREGTSIQANVIFNKKTNDGVILQFRKDNTTVGEIGVGNSNDIYIGNDDCALLITDTENFAPFNPNTLSLKDDAIDLGAATARFDDVYATNGTIQTSDRNEKQDIEELSEAEQRVAIAAKALMRKFRWKSAIEEKGDDARIHFGIIAQDLQAAFEAEGLDAGRYAMFISSTWWETQTEVPAVEAVDAVYETVTIPAEYDEDGNEITPEATEERLVSEAVEGKEAHTRTDTYNTEEEAPEGAVKKSRMGVRYSELLAFIIAAI